MEVKPHPDIRDIKEGSGFAVNNLTFIIYLSTFTSDLVSDPGCVFYCRNIQREKSLIKPLTCAYIP